MTTNNLNTSGDNAAMENRIWQRSAKPEAWLNQAEALRLAADKLWDFFIPHEPGLNFEQGAYSTTALMLIGFSFENLFKGLLVFQKPYCDTDKRWTRLS